MVKVKSYFSDVAASFVVFLVALPLSLGIALASGAPIRSGLIAAIIGGITVGLLGGAPLQVSGPAAGLTVMVFGFVEHFGFESTCIITVLAGLIQMILGFLQVAPLTLMISPAVIHAMLAGIGILISLGQFHVFLGFKPHKNAIENILSLVQEVPKLNMAALGLGIFTFMVLILWNRFLSKKIRFIPASLVAVTLGTVISLLTNANVPRIEISSALFSAPHFPLFGQLMDVQLWISAAALALVASAESLLCAVATDKLHTGPRAHLNRELLGQGVANTLSGLLAGLPVTGVIVRSSANISAGAKTRLSSILHGVWLLLFSALFTVVIQQIPLAVLAALLIQVGLNLVKLQEMKKLAQYGELFIYVATLAGVVFINLLWGIGIGFALSLLVLLYRLGHLKLSIKEKDSGEIELKLDGVLTFLSVPQLTQLLQSIPAGKSVYLQFDIEMLDFAALDAIRGWRVSYEKNGGRVIKKSLDDIWSMLKATQKVS